MGQSAESGSGLVKNNKGKRGLKIFY